MITVSLVPGEINEFWIICQDSIEHSDKRQNIVHGGIYLKTIHMFRVILFKNISCVSYKFKQAIQYCEIRYI